MQTHICHSNLMSSLFTETHLGLDAFKWFLFPAASYLVWYMVIVTIILTGNIDILYYKIKFRLDVDTVYMIY